jgi:pimeloyl-ACP methyl ester carboxylesterase
MKWLALVGLLLTVGCAVQNRQSLGPELAVAAGWHWESLPAGSFDLAVATKPGGQGRTLTVYIEGDGLAYVTPTERSMDPTPTDPVALRLALSHPGDGPVAYLARPCQYPDRQRPRNCRDDYWSSARYAPEVVNSVNAALDQLKARTRSADRLVLVGFSGGGALAALLAERRSDVVGLVTVAANLDLAQWVSVKKLTPLYASLDPADQAGRLSDLPQVHFIGSEDAVVERSVLRAFLSQMRGDARVQTIEVAGQTHGCCWADAWAGLARRGELSVIPDWVRQ